MSTSKSRLFGALGALCEEIQTQKTAAQAALLRGKQASPTPSDPGYIGGSSEHPTASADNGCQTATEGERSSENESDVKDQQGPPSVNNTAEATPGADKDKSLNIGTKASLVGEDPSVEDDFKGDKHDPGTSSPATTEDGEKYGSFRKSAKAAIELGNSVLADLAVGVVSKTAGTTPAASAPAAKPAAKTAAAPAAAAGMLAGYEFAQALGMNDKVAQAHVSGMIANAVREGHEVGAMVGAFLRKKAADEAESGAGEDHASEKGKPEEGGGSGSGANASSSTDSGSGGGSPAPAGPPGGGLGGGNPLASIMGGAGGGGGAPPADPMAGGAPGAGGMGGDPMAGGQASPEEALQELAMALQELGVPLDQLAAAGAAGAGGGMAPPPGGGMGGPPPGGAMGGPPPMDPAAGGGAPPMTEGAKLAAAVKNFQRSGKFEIKAADTKRARHIRNQMKAHVLELINS